MSDFRILDAARVEGVVTPFHWEWAEREAAWIDARWAALLADKPAMFDGPVLMAHRWAVEGETFRVEFFPTRFSRFLCWREAGRPGALANCFAGAALRSADGAFILGEMGAHTANAGKIYFAAGTPDPDDVVGDAVDLAGSALRELAEETGIAPGDVSIEPQWTIVMANGLIACLRQARIALSGEAALVSIHRALELQDDRELARMHLVCSRAEIDPARMPAYLVAYLDHELAA